MLEIRARSLFLRRSSARSSSVSVFCFLFLRVSDIRSYAAVILRQTCSEADRAISAKLAIRLISSNEEIGWVVIGGNSLGGISRGFQGGPINWVFGTRADPCDPPPQAEVEFLGLFWER